jgi:hypothetical protein
LVTELEKKQQRKALLSDIEDAKEDLAYLREKAFRMAESFAQISRTIRNNGRLEPSKADFSVESELENKLKPEYEAVFDFPKTVAVIDELHTARKRVFNLLERQAQLSPSSFAPAIPND